MCCIIGDSLGEDGRLAGMETDNEQTRGVREEKLTGLSQTTGMIYRAGLVACTKLIIGNARVFL